MKFKSGVDKYILREKKKKFKNFKLNYKLKMDQKNC
jgi:hypothetical protein